jgi:hypothetical protein
MPKSIRDIAKKRGRPKTTGLGEGVLVRLHDPLLSGLDEWRATQEGNPSRPEAIRRMIEIVLSATQGTKRALKSKSPAAKPRRTGKRKEGE